MVWYFLTRFPFPPTRLQYFRLGGLVANICWLKCCKHKILCPKRYFKSFIQYGTKNYHVLVLHQKGTPVKTIPQLITTTAVLVKINKLHFMFNFIENLLVFLP